MERYIDGGNHGGNVKDILKTIIARISVLVVCGIFVSDKMLT